jgi:hypothetical protein
MMIESNSIKALKRFPCRSHSQMSPSSAGTRLSRRLRVRYTVRRSIHSYWFYLLFCVLGTTDIHFVLFGSNESFESTSSDDGNIRFGYRSAAPYCFASEVKEDTDHMKSSRKAKAASVSMKPASIVTLPTTNAAPVENSSTKLPKEKLSLNQILYRAGKRGLGGGIPGAIAGGFQVLSLMWLRTIINYQCRYGTTFLQALRTLLNDGGIARLYCGVGFALIQAPLARFVSTAANDGVESLLANLSFTKDWGPGQTTVVASIVVGLWRMLLMRT